MEEFVGDFFVEVFKEGTGKFGGEGVFGENGVDFFRDGDLAIAKVVEVRRKGFSLV